MSISQPIDVSRLKGILGNAKKIMGKVETGNYETGHVDGRALTEEGVRELQAEGVRRPISQGQQQVDTSRIQNSKLPESIKKAMMENPIAQPTGLHHTFNLEDVSDMEYEKPMSYPSTRQPMRENVNYQQPQQQAFGGYSENVLKAMIKDVLIEYLSNEYSKNLTESVIKQTISTLLSEGKITTKKRA